MKIRTWEYFIREAMGSLRYNGMMSVASICTVALSLFILGLFLTMVLNLNNMAENLESQVQISAYMQDNLNDREIREIGTKLTKLPGVVQVTYVSKEEAMNRFKHRLGEHQNMLAALGDGNPLPNAFEVKVDKPEQVKPVADAMMQIKGVENIKYGQEIINKLFQITKIIRIFGAVLIVFLAFAAIFIISNTIRLTVFARRKEIGIMKDVGATDWFIRWPFIIEGVILGFFGALIAVLLLREGYSIIIEQVYAALAFLPLVPRYPFLTYMSTVLLTAGTIIGAVGSTISLKKFLKV